jgi:excisionase family DNA binding protein
VRSHESEKNGQYQTIERAAKYLKIKKGTLYQYTSRGQVEHFKIGGRLLFKEEMLEQFIEKGRMPILKLDVF